MLVQDTTQNHGNNLPCFSANVRRQPAQHRRDRGEGGAAGRAIAPARF